MDQPTIETLATRLDKVERENRSLKRINNFVLVGIIATIVMGQSQCNLSKTGGSQVSKVVEAQEFIVRDATGKQRAKIAERGLEFTDANGKQRAYLNVGEIVSNLTFFYGGGHLATFGVCYNEMKLIDFSCPYSAELVLNGSEGTLRINAGNPPSQNGFKSQPSLSISSNKGGHIHLEGNNIDLYDGSVRRIGLSADTEGASINLLDKNRRTRATLGSTSLTGIKTGTVTTTTESSLVLFDKSGKVIWRTPE